MAKKEFTYRGKNLQELQSLDLKALAAVFPAPSRRKLLRGLSEGEKTLLKNLEQRDRVKTHCRDMLVLPAMIGKTVMLHTGKEFAPLTMTEQMLGHRLGEFALTRKRVQHSAPGIGATRSSASASVR